MLVMEMTLNHSIELHGKPVEVTLTENARNALSRRIKPLAVEMELYFSCLIRKQVRFSDAGNGNDARNPMEARLNDRMRIRFRPVMTQACGKDYEGDEPPLTDFPIANTKAYIPHWLTIDHKNGKWTGEFGYRSKS
ncbi:hypothetical protein [Kaarinaea lacus]